MTNIEKQTQITKEFAQELIQKLTSEDIAEIKEQVESMRPLLQELEIFGTPEIVDKINNMPAAMAEKLKEQSLALWPEFEVAYSTQDPQLIENIVDKSMDLARGNFAACGIMLHDKVYDAMKVLGIKSMSLMKKLGVSAQDLFARNMQYVACY